MDTPKKNVSRKRKNKSSDDISVPKYVKKLKSNCEETATFSKKDTKSKVKGAKDKDLSVPCSVNDDCHRTDSYNKNSDFNDIWDEAEMLSYVEKVPKPLAQGFIKLLNDGCTLPFIARYRKEMVDNLMPDRLQDLYESFQSVCQLKKKAKSVIETLKKSNKLTADIEKSILKTKNISEIDLIYAPLKSHSLSLAERARKLGLEVHAISALSGQVLELKSLCKDDQEELSSVEMVENNITHIVADIIYKDPRVMQKMRELKEETRFLLKSSRSKSSLKVKEQKDNKKLTSKSDPETYSLYFDWEGPTQFIKPHQTLALNRGEDEKILTLKVIVPDWFYNQLERFCATLWKNGYWIRKGLGDAYNRLIKPWLSRQVRSELTKVAEKEAIRTFTSNLEKYLLTEPIKNRRIMGLDPGFKAGCKIGIIDADGKKLEACTVYPNLKNRNGTDPIAKKVKDLITKYKVELIGLGNGTACRETEYWLKSHNISIDTPVIIVPEQGASIYSVSKEAQKEHPNMDPNLISALSIARRVLDPLGELIKVDPKNLGVGLYQHDISPKLLASALDCTVEKIVSLVGVDINTASQVLLRRIAGLNETRAAKIITYRQENGGFKTREEILKISGIGKISFQQCAGFLKVVDGPEPLDNTIIHPESYNIAKSFAKKLELDTKNLLTTQFSRSFERKVAYLDILSTSEELGTDLSTLKLIINVFKQTSNKDDEVKFAKPVYSVTIEAMEQLTEGMTVTGVVRNVVPFGCFVDCGVKENGLIHRKNFGNNEPPKLGDSVRVTVVASTKPNKIQLKLENIL